MAGIKNYWQQWADSSSGSMEMLGDDQSLRLVKLRSGSFEALILNYGARLVSFLGPDGVNGVLSPESPESL